MAEDNNGQDNQNSQVQQSTETSSSGRRKHLKSYVSFMAEAEKHKEDSLNASKEEIIELCNQIDQLASQDKKQSHAKELTHAYVEIGSILNDLEDSLPEGEYDGWLEKHKDHFGKYIAYFESAKKLSTIQEFAEKYGHFGKDLLLEFEKLVSTKFEEQPENKKITKNEKRTEEKKRIIEGILNDSRYSTHIQGSNGDGLSARKLEALITLYRFWEAKITYPEFKHALKMVEIKNGFVKERVVNDVRIWLDRFETVEVRKERFETYLRNNMKFPDGWNIRQEKKKLRYVLGEFIPLCENVDFELEETIPEDLCAKALGYIEKVEKILRAKTAPTQGTETAGTAPATPAEPPLVEVAG